MNQQLAQFAQKFIFVGRQIRIPGVELLRNARLGLYNRSKIAKLRETVEEPEDDVAQD